MTILEAIEAVKNTITPVPEFFYADLNEANINVDALANSQFPIMIVLPFIPIDNPGKSGVLKTTAEIEIFFLNKKTDQATIEYSSIVVENEIIAHMRALARNFWYKFNQHSIIDKETNGITGIRYQPVYSSLDANVHGVWCRATVPIMEKITGC